ncbi:MAG: hypothetical protein A2808_01840 [Candidatus Moranbacteria bacterium RIFCSPHIGHO2_01_FULL_55_24]|nr:MAG: hypothetical protein A2808_01840 [Candidatus Moranbacteria bacterium RIFCSPHIGHO2_01_FULL_55_24]
MARSKDFFDAFVLKTPTFLFIGLVFFSVVFFVSASDSTVSSKNLFEDGDQDNLTNEEESLYGTNPQKKDTDGDGYSDGVEVESGYNPLIPAPGDRIVPAFAEKNTSADATVADVNITEQVSNEIASVLKNSNGDEEITLEDVNQAVQKVLAGDTEDVTLPEVDIKEIKIKKAPSKSLKPKERDERERKDIVEYLTVMSYLMANNSPKAFHSEDELGSLLESVSTQSIAALGSGNTAYLDALSEKGEKILEETKGIEVPEKMLDVHIKAIKMAKYAKSLKDELKPNQNDPLGQIAVLSKVQGLTNVTVSFITDIEAKLAEYDIQEIPLDL